MTRDVVMACCGPWTPGDARRSLGVVLWLSGPDRATHDFDRAVQTNTSEAAESEVASQLATRVRAGDRAAETTLIERYQRGLLSLLRRKTGDRSLADDLCQDTFRIALERLRGTGIDEPHRLASFLYGIATNLVITHFRRERRRDTHVDLEVVNLVPDPNDRQLAELSREQVARCVREMLDELTTSRDREILLRYYIDERTREEICVELGLDHLHFNRVLFRAKDRFRALVLRAERRRHLGLVPGGLAGDDRAPRDYGA